MLLTKETFIAMKTIRWSIIAISLALLLCSCVPPAKMYVGKSVAAENVISLPPAMEQSGAWKTFDVELNYRALMNADRLDLAVQGRLSQHYEMMYSRVNYFYLELYLLDGQNKVLETVFLSTVDLMTTRDTFQDQRSLTVPVGTRGLSFGYRGMASEREDVKSFDFRPMMKE